MRQKKVIIPLLLLALLGYGVYWAFFDMDRLPKGDFISEADSPNGDYTVKAYVSSGGATTDFAVRAELHFNKENRKPKTVYWNYHEEQAVIKWMDQDTVVINGHWLDVPYDVFDFRKN
ncbi:DUF5412 domain-containing protein [Domibacillus sp. DTU_2020_1001157_1_SI_ALB_TIR_016]|uniref:DUF5412 domain-containing protein n=1 Tax=Domibacillus sp. DTU_2020_1001157_1_SI_ALB_TIR_016 TaxID=3077789 RepID=UPI0028E1B249|nr:DUF5412 domain-containing protein [Domibacillus sp. DTU_2020_1001157_1_SI_ALB_TIR_016]WNS78309.1 DUF5412 domain-containing protein [Domibacillus sp. DTU_2020_1001157_1_SI_ALB_TIR_016]